MADVEISYNGDTIVSMSDSGTEYLDTKGKFMADNITINYTKSGGGGSNVTTVAFEDDCTFGGQKVIYTDGDGVAHVVSSEILVQYGTACTYQMLSGSTIVIFGDVMSGGAYCSGTYSGITPIDAGTINVLAGRDMGTVAYVVFQVD